MAQFNLLREPWISVMTDDKGTTREVSLAELFENAHEFKRLAGETPAQDFAVLRLLLAIMHTVISRFDYDGNVYDFLELDEKFRQKYDVDEDDQAEYMEAMFDTWKTMWNSARLPSIIKEYLYVWSDRFNLYDEKFPFYQVTKSDMEKLKIQKTGSINPKLMNRRISESNNKVELFSPYSENYKNDLDNASLARWLVAFQAYTGTGDKAKFPGMKVSASKGWLLGLGGVFLSGKSLKETLLLNMHMMMKPSRQTPVWEKELDELIIDLLNKQPDNLSALYTNWSRLLEIKSRSHEDIIAEVKAVQLPGINPQEFILEQMTLWRFPKTGKDKDHWIPRTHDANRFFWRSFDQIISSTQNVQNKIPGIIEWHNFLVGNQHLDGRIITIASVGLSYNRDASTMPNDDIYDELNIYDEILADVGENGWVARISEEIQKIDSSINYIFKGFLEDIKKIRNITSNGIVESQIQEAFFVVDAPFREWLYELRPSDSKNDMIKKWREKFRSLLAIQAEQLLTTAGNRDFIGINDGKKYINIEIAYNIFRSRLNKNLKVEEGGKLWKR